jgi:septal ring factor EnvC (AmiA/AmiB activator)
VRVTLDNANVVTREEFQEAMSALSDKIAAIKDQITALAASEAEEDADSTAKDARIADLEAQIADLQTRVVTPEDQAALDALTAQLADAKFGKQTEPAPAPEPTV